MSASDCEKPSTDCLLPTCDNHICGTKTATAGSSCNDSGGTICDGMGNCIPAVPCAIGETRCDGNVPETCPAGVWLPTDACGGETPRCCPGSAQCFAGVQSVATGAHHACAVLTDGTLWCWGANDVGQLGNGSLSVDPTTVPTFVDWLGYDVAEVAPGFAHTCARTKEGNVWCWGANILGELGIGNADGVSHSEPEEVTGLGTTVVQLAASTNGSHTCARKANGSIWCWGLNDVGQIGTGAVSAPHEAPVQATVAGMDNSDVKVGAFHTCVRKTDKTVWCWGSNATLALGNGAAGDPQLTAIKAGLESAEIISLTAGSFHTCAVKAEGSAWCWGESSVGQLGLGAPGQDVGIPTLILGLSADVTGIFGGASGTCATKSDGSAWCWGDNKHGEVGDGTFNQANSPVHVSTLGTGVASISAGARLPVRAHEGRQCPVLGRR